MEIKWDLLSKHKEEIYGMSILWIMLLHGLVRGHNGELISTLHVFSELIKHGNCGVDVFLFLSGICLFFSMKKDSDTISFYKKRCLRILIPYLGITGVYWFYTNIIVRHDYISFIKNITQYSFWFGNVHFAWFIGAIFILYSIYPIIFKKFLIKKEGIFTGNGFLWMIIFIYFLCYFFNCHPYFHDWYKNVEVALTRLPIFLLGCYCGKQVYDKKRISPTIKLVSFFIILVCIVWFNNRYPIVSLYRIPYFIFAPCLALWMAIFFEVINNRGLNCFFSHLGRCSLELYLLHMVLQNVTINMNLYNLDKVVSYNKYLLVCVGGSILIASALNPLFNKVREFLKR